MLLCCLRRNVEASCPTFRRRLPPSTNSAAYQRLVSSTRHGPSQLGVLHLALAACDGARYWLRIAISAYPTCVRRPRQRGTFPSEYRHGVWYGKLEWCGHPTVKKIEDMFIRFNRIHERDRQTDRRTPHDGIGRDCIASRGKNH